MSSSSILLCQNGGVFFQSRQCLMSHSNVGDNLIFVMMVTMAAILLSKQYTQVKSNNHGQEDNDKKGKFGL